MENSRNQKQFRPIQFAGVDPVHPVGPERERTYIHPNAVKVWAGRLG